MPAKELAYPRQVIAWLEDWGSKVQRPAELTLIGSAALLWHVHQLGRDDALPENSMDVDPVTSSEEIAELAYDALIGSEFEKEHGWHVNLMPHQVLSTFPRGWEERVSTAIYGRLTVTVPSVDDLLVPKLERGEPRDLNQARFVSELGMVESDAILKKLKAGDEG